MYVAYALSFGCNIIISKGVIMELDLLDHREIKACMNEYEIRPFFIVHLNKANFLETSLGRVWEW
jgi:hypothetical protein